MSAVRDIGSRPGVGLASVADKKNWAERRRVAVAWLERMDVGNLTLREAAEVMDVDPERMRDAVQHYIKRRKGYYR